MSATIRPPAGSLTVHGGVEQAGAPPSNPVVVPGGALARPLASQRFQEDFVLRVLEELGFDQERVLTGNDEGGVKGRVREICQARDPAGFTDDKFDKAWKRLRALARDSADKGVSP